MLCCPVTTRGAGKYTITDYNHIDNCGANNSDGDGYGYGDGDGDGEGEVECVVIGDILGDGNRHVHSSTPTAKSNRDVV